MRSTLPPAMPNARHERPRIGVTGPDRGGTAAWLFTSLAVTLAGGRPVWITPGRPRRAGGLRGLIIGGGADVDPEHYGQELLEIATAKRPDEQTWPYLLGLLVQPMVWIVRRFLTAKTKSRGDPARDALEMRLIHEAIRRGLPILGICRGEQLLNVRFGGSLHQDLSHAGFYTEDPEVRTVLPRKRVNVPAGSRLAAVLGEHPPRVNALHRQAIDRLGAGLRVAARDRNGIVYAIEHESLPFVVGVQWHPEYLPQSREQRALFRALVREAGR